MSGHRMALWLALGLSLGSSAAAAEESAPGAPAARDRAKQCVEQLMSEGLPFAEKLLREDGEFLPFGALRVREGPIRIVGAPSDDELPDAGNVLERLLSDMRQGAQRREYEAIAVFANVEIPRPGDGKVVSAVFVGLEHQDGYCADVFFPYTRSEGRVELGTSFAGFREGSVFGSCDPARSDR
jgi:hypothetical protein